MILGYLTQKGLIRKYGREVYQRDLKKRFPMVSTLGVLGIVFVAMALKADSIHQQPERSDLRFPPGPLTFHPLSREVDFDGKLFMPRATHIA